MRLVLLFVVLFSCYAGGAVAEIYRYVDSRGELHFVDDMSKVPKKYRAQLDKAPSLPELSVMDAGPANRGRKAPVQQAEPQTSYGDATVELYVTSWCGYCKKMTRFLDEKKIAYVAYDIEKDSSAERTYRQIGGRGVPVARIGSRIVHGYDPEGVMAALQAGR